MKKPHPLAPSYAFLKRDPHIGPLMKRFGFIDRKHTTNAYEALARSIVYQQLSGKAAGTIWKRFVSLYSRKRLPKPEVVLATNRAMLRSVGLSGQKVEYLYDLSKKFIDGTIAPRSFMRLTDDAIVEHLTRVKGIGTWTAHMFLMFSLQRPGILPVGDLGIQKGFQKVFGLKRKPSERTMRRLAKPWGGHFTVASWYLWRSLDGD